MRIVTPSSLGRDYDYLIVGSGPAGSMLARRLQHAGRVLVLEAGAVHRGPLSRTPAYYPRSFGSRIDWSYQTEPQPKLAHRKLAWPSGRVFGGSTAINAMIRIEPDIGCLREIHAACGEDWTIESSQRLFSELRGFWPGALPDLHSNTLSVLSHAIDQGLGSNQGLESPRSEISPYVRMQVRGRRQVACQLITCDALAGALVSSLLIESDRVSGVAVEVEGERFELRARKQVILCCGAIQTPRILFQSGIGPVDTLAGAGLECHYPHQRVGVGLQDHLVYPLVYRLRTGQAFSCPFGRVDRLRYVEHGQGPKASNLAELGAFFDLENSGALTVQWHLTPTHYLAYPKLPIDDPCLSVGVTQCKPRSVGAVVPIAVQGVKGNVSGQIALRIDPCYLSDPLDWDAYLQAIRWSREYFQRSVWSEQIEEEIVPGPKRVTLDSLGSHVARFATTLYHYSGSCSMGCDPEHPVDPRFKLRGVEGLRICDASVFPRILGCNPQTTIMMLAMKLGNWLLEES